MARALRILFEGGNYHVINRGQSKRDIFLDAKDYKNFLDIMREACRTYQVKITAYCLMKNHYHLLVHTPKANLPSFMRQINSVYTQIFNKKYNQDGSLFKGRYKSVVVQEGSYLLRLIKYIHTNPLKAGLVEKLSDYNYCSHKEFILDKEFDWLKFRDVLKSQFGNVTNVKQAYIEFMDKVDEELDVYLKEKSLEAISSIIYGETDFQDKIKANYLQADKYYGEIPAGKKFKNDLKIEKIKEEVKNIFNVSEQELYKSVRGKENIARMIAVGLSREITGLSCGVIGEIFGGLSYKTISMYCKRLKERCLLDKRIRRIFEDLRETCSQVET